MLEKIKNIFNNKEKRIENLFSFLIILSLTILINSLETEGLGNDKMFDNSFIEFSSIIFVFNSFCFIDK